MKYLMNKAGDTIMTRVRPLRDIRGENILKEDDGKKLPVMVDNEEALKSQGFNIEITEEEFLKIREEKKAAKKAKKENKAEKVFGKPTYGGAKKESIETKVEEVTIEEVEETSGDKEQTDVPVEEVKPKKRGRKKKE